MLKLVTKWLAPLAIATFAGGTIAAPSEASDRQGQEALWVADSDGRNPQLLFQDFHSRILEPTWSPDGTSIIATRRRSGPMGFYEFTTEVWQFPLDGSAPARLLAFGEGDKRAAVAGAGEPSADGQLIYFHSFAKPGSQRVHLRQLEVATGDIVDVTEPVSPPELLPARPGEMAPKPSPDGRFLAFVRQRPGTSTEWRGHSYGPQTGLWLLDLKDGTERLLLPSVTKDASLFVYKHKRRVFPDYNWSRDSRQIVLTMDGGLALVDVPSGEVRAVPFTARVERTISEQVRARQSVAGPLVTVRTPRWASTSPDGTHIEFQALGRIWLATGHDEPRLLTGAEAGAGKAMELTPSWSADGASVLFVSWDDQKGGHVWRTGIDGRDPEQLTRSPGRYLFPMERDGVTCSSAPGHLHVWA